MTKSDGVGKKYMGSKYRICVKMTYNKSLPLNRCEKNPKEWRIRPDNFGDQIKKCISKNNNHFVHE